MERMDLAALILFCMVFAACAAGIKAAIWPAQPTAVQKLDQTDPREPRVCRGLDPGTCLSMTIDNGPSTLVIPM
jgi:hypothetical protein